MLIPEIILPKGTKIRLDDEVLFRSPISYDNRVGRVAGIRKDVGSYGQLRIVTGQVSEWVSIESQIRAIGESFILTRKTGGHGRN